MIVSVSEAIMTIKPKLNMLTTSRPNWKSSLAYPVLAVLLMAAAVLALSLSTRFSAAQSGSQLTVAGTQAAPFSSSLPQMDGTHLRTIVVEVNYAPGEA